MQHNVSAKLKELLKEGDVVTTSFIQRNLGVGFPHAKSIMDEMIEKGYVVINEKGDYLFDHLPEIIHAKQIIFPEANKAVLAEKKIDPESIGDNEVVVKNIVTTISAGTERANITGLRVGEAPVCFPRYPGYSNCGEVIAIGKNVTKVKVGDIVVPIWGFHASHNVFAEDKVVKVPEGIEPEQAALSFIGTFSIAAVRKIRLEIGENCAVIGLGVLGQLAVSFAKAAGAYPVVAIDMNAARREEALANGADFAFDPSDPDYIKKVLEVCPDGYTTAIEVTGVGEALVQTLELMNRFGRVALLGCTRDSNFSIDYYARVHTPGVELIGAHTLARPNFESRPHCFTVQDDLKSIFGMIKGKRVNLLPMIKGTYSPEECQDVYDKVINDREFPAIVQFDWRKF